MGQLAAQRARRSGDEGSVGKAIHDAQQHIPAFLDTDWLNTKTQLWMLGPMHDELTQF
jgi:hypothetical protein